MSTASGVPEANAPARRSDVQIVRYEKYIDNELRKTRRQVRMVDLTWGAMALLTGALAYLFAAALVDQWLVAGGLGHASRTVALGLFLAGAIGWTAWAVAPLLFRKINPVYAARAIEQSRPSLKNGLVNFLMLRGHPESISPAVFAQIEKQAATGLSQAPLENTVDRSHLLKLAYVLLGIVSVLAIYKVASPKDPIRSVRRVLAPWADIAPATRVRINDVDPREGRAFNGRFVKVSAEITGLRSSEQPQIFFSTADGQVVAQSAPMNLPPGEFRYVAELPPGQGGLQQDMEYWIEAGDAKTPHYPIHVLTTPSIVVDKIEYRLPRYTDVEWYTTDRQGDIVGLEGTEVVIHATANEDIKSASIDFDCDGSVDMAMKADGRKATVNFTLALKKGEAEHSSYLLRFTNTDGEENPQPLRYKIEVTPDRPPVITFTEPIAKDDQDQTIQPNEVLRLVVQASDPDYKLKEVNVVAERNGKPWVKHSLLPAADAQLNNGMFLLGGSKLGLKAGDTIEYWAEAIDNKAPTPNSAQTSKRRLRVAALDPKGTGQRKEGAAGDPDQQNPDRNQDQKPNDGARQEGEPKKGPNEPRDGDRRPQQERGTGKPEEPQTKPRNEDAKIGPRDTVDDPKNPDRGEAPKDPEKQRADGKPPKPDRDPKAEEKNPNKPDPKADPEQPQPDKKEQKPEEKKVSGEADPGKVMQKALQHAEKEKQKQQEKDPQQKKDPPQNQKKDPPQNTAQPDQNPPQQNQSQDQKPKQPQSKDEQQKKEQEKKEQQQGGGESQGNDGGEGESQGQGSSGGKSGNPSGESKEQGGDPKQQGGQPGKPDPKQQGGGDPGPDDKSNSSDPKGKSEAGGGGKSPQKNELKGKGDAGKNELGKGSEKDTANNKTEKKNPGEKDAGGASGKGPKPDASKANELDKTGQPKNPGADPSKGENPPKEQLGDKPGGKDEEKAAIDPKSGSKKPGEKDGEDQGAENKGQDKGSGDKGNEKKGASEKPNEDDKGAGQKGVGGKSPDEKGSDDKPGDKKGEDQGAQGSEQGTPGKDANPKTKPKSESGAGEGKATGQPGEKKDDTKDQGDPTEGGEEQKEGARSKTAPKDTEGAKYVDKKPEEASPDDKIVGKGKPRPDSKSEKTDDKTPPDAKAGEDGKPSPAGQKGEQKTPGAKGEKAGEKQGPKSDQKETGQAASKDPKPPGGDKSQQPKDPSASDPKQQGNASGDAKSDSKEGSPKTDQAVKPNEKTSDDATKQKEGNSGDPQAPSKSQKDSNTKGQKGDESGEGGQGGGKASNSAGTGSKGQNTDADDGGGVSQQPGDGETSNQPGAKKPAEGEKGGQPSEQAGKGKTSRSGEKQEAGTTTLHKEELSSGGPGTGPAGKSFDGRGNPTAGSGNPGTDTKAGDIAPPPPKPEGRTADEANLEYSKKATDLALDYLKDQLAKGQPDQELLDELKWTRDDMDRFVKQWERFKKQENAADPAERRQFDERLEALGLRPQGTAIKGGRLQEKTSQSLHQTKRSEPPPEYSQQYRVFSSGGAKSRQPAGK